MSLTAGNRLGPYEVIAPLGAGGMGEVYRARDTKLNRDVALKVLPEAFAADADRVARFRREAQVLAALNHPNIAHIHGFEDSSGTHALVIELVEGPTLAERIAAAPRGLPLRDVLNISRQISEALNEAHQRGIIHRDLKPANIKVTPSGIVKLLDFGLAKELVDASDASALVTVTDETPKTRVGSVLGTMAYMSPEQARGEVLDTRTDLFSFGAVLYEMSTGRRAFDAAVATLVVDAVLHRSPAIPAASTVPPRLERIIVRLLEKDRAARYQRASDVRVDLQQLEQEIYSTSTSVAKRSPLPRMALAAVGAIVLAAAGFTGWMWSKSAGTPPPRPVEYAPVTAFTDSAVSPSLSRDGRMMTFVQGADTFFGPGQIYVKALPDGEPVQLTHDRLQKMNPVFSPDGSTVAYTAGAPPSTWDTWTVSALGGEPHQWLRNAAALSWVGEKQIMFSEITSGLHLRLMTSDDQREHSRPVYDPSHQMGMVHRSHLSPDGRSVLIIEMESGAWLPCRVAPFDGSSPGRSAGPKGQCTDAAWSPDGRWMFTASNASGAFHIWRQRFPDGVPEQITSGPSEEEGIAIAPDGRSMLTSLGNAQQAMWVRDQSGERPLSREGFAFVPSPPDGSTQPFSSDGGKLFYLVRRGPIRSAGAQARVGELWKTDLETGHSEAVLPGVSIVGYDTSRDGTQLTFAALDERGVSHVWLTRIDRRLPPRALTPLEADNPRFDAAGDIFCRVTESASPQGLTYRFKTDGSAPQKVADVPLLFFMGVSPDGTLVVGRATSSITLTLAFPIPSGSPIPICSTCQVDWSPDGSALVVRFEGSAENSPRTVTLALERGRMLPRLPAGGIQSQSDLAGLSVTTDVAEFVFPGSKPKQYAFTRGTIQRNIYQVPLSD